LIPRDSTSAAKFRLALERLFPFGRGCRWRCGWAGGARGTLLLY